MTTESRAGSAASLPGSWQLREHAVADGMTGRSYTLGPDTATVIARWVTPSPCSGGVTWHRPPKRGAPRNVLLERPDGSRTVRPFRGCRSIKGENDDD